MHIELRENNINVITFQCNIDRIDVDLRKAKDEDSIEFFSFIDNSSKIKEINFIISKHQDEKQLHKEDLSDMVGIFREMKVKTNIKVM